EAVRDVRPRPRGLYVRWLARPAAPQDVDGRDGPRARLRGVVRGRASQHLGEARVELLCAWVGNLLRPHRRRVDVVGRRAGALDEVREREARCTTREHLGVETHFLYLPCQRYRVGGVGHHEDDVGVQAAEAIEDGPEVRARLVVVLTVEDRVAAVCGDLVDRVRDGGLEGPVAVD